jgi:hypothetical protein
MASAGVLIFDFCNDLCNRLPTYVSVSILGSVSFSKPFFEAFDDQQVKSDSRVSLAPP